MADYLPIIIGAIIFIALMWWLLSLGSAKKDAARTDAKPPKAVPAPPVAATAAPAAKLMDDPKPTPKTAPPKPQAPLKAAATKAAPSKTTKPATKKAAAPKAAAPKAVTAKVAAPKAPAKAAAKPKVAAPKAKPPAAAKVATKPAAKPKAAPKPAAPKPAAPKPAAPKPAAKAVIPDNLELLKGVGPKVNNLLKSMGITSFDQVANWTPAEITEIDSKLGAFAGRIGRDNWVDQAKLLVAGDVAGFEKKYGALGSEIAKG